MTEFLGKDFLLESESAKTLYHSYAAKMPVMDYHSHNSPQEIYENHRFANLAEAWLGRDHYKWRLMRAGGAPEHLVSGGAPGWDKFLAFAKALPRAAGNPVYHWAHLELQRYFNCNIVLNEHTAQEIWAHCNQLLQTDENYRVRGLIRQSGVTALYTTDDPADSLEWHQKLRGDGSFETKVLPAFRPDKAMQPDKPGFAPYVQQLAKAAGRPIAGLQDMKDALAARIDHFHAVGCRASDHGVNGVSPVFSTGQAADEALRLALAGGELSPAQAEGYRGHLLDWLGEEYARRGWVMEIHFGAQRNVNSRAFAALGPDTGHDCIIPATRMDGLALLFDGLERRGALPKTLVYSLNPTDNAAITTLCGSFYAPGSAGKLQQGSAWWFNDTLPGMAEQITNFAATGVLGNFVGMLTDSRSFLSYTRHEYFRRVLCNVLGGWVDKGLYPAHMEALGALVQDVSYNNAMAFFELG